MLIPEPPPIVQHLFRLEHLFLTLHELWVMHRAGNRIGRRWLRAVVEPEYLPARPDASHALPLTLDAGNRMCTEALAFIRRHRSEETSSGIEQKLHHLRDLLVAANELYQAFPSANPFADQYRSAHEHLANLLGEDPAVDRDELMDCCLARGGSIATAAVAALQSR